MNKSAFEKLMWSIALPGFGQYLNGKYFKGTVLLILEFLINVQANFNQVILLSFHGEIGDAIQHADYQWLMFYPCLYLFAMCGMR
ncbi:membrane protein [Peribacillus asahii]|uniref:Membrane protein n=1 Tax=Peribacillus asahii TaxID=228899 RepID=A0A3Q9RNN4_9BACI|nr:membrane protein [Peribacillus asahii]